MSDHIKGKHAAGTDHKPEKIDISNAAPIAGGVLADGDLSADISNCISGIVNHNTTAFDRAIDAAYVHDGIGSAATHHIVDGSHTFWGAFNAARESGGDTAGQASAAFEHLLRDFTTTSGINPVISMDPDTLVKVKDAFEKLNVPRSQVNDLLTMNLFEAVGALLVGLAACHGFKKKDFEMLGRIIGAGSSASLVGANPLMAVVTIVIAARAWRISSEPERKKLVRNAVKGSIVTCTVAAVSAAIGGPVIIGLVPAVYAGHVVNTILSGKKCDDPVSRVIKKGARAALSTGLTFIVKKI